MKNTIKIKIHNVKNTQILRELIDEFLPPENYELMSDDGFIKDGCLHINLKRSQDKDDIRREIFNSLKAITGYTPPWGILTGVRPVKLAGELLEELGNKEKVYKTLTEKFYISHEKAVLILNTYDRQISKCGKAPYNSVSLYIGIPFCPTRCVYCSFTSNQVGNEEIEKYLVALYKEIKYVGKKLIQYGINLESLYIGGGTPTTLNHTQLKSLLEVICSSFDMSKLKEFTVEAGRPDTIDSLKLDILKEFNVDRISINPQSMKQETLDIIGRNHSPDDIRTAFKIAKAKKFPIINADLIAGLPGENNEDFINTLKEILKLGANNITIHTLAVKRASRLKDIDNNYHYKVANEVERMINSANQILLKNKFHPYYLYRQKHMAGGLENTGYELNDTDSIYNVRIMDEHQTIIALGAGGITKRYYKENNKLERIPNVSNYQEYIRRIDEMIQRKEDKLWR